MPLPRNLHRRSRHRSSQRTVRSAQPASTPTEPGIGRRLQRNSSGYPKRNSVQSPGKPRRSAQGETTPARPGKSPSPCPRSPRNRSDRRHPHSFPRRVRGARPPPRPGQFAAPTGVPNFSSGRGRVANACRPTALHPRPCRKPFAQPGTGAKRFRTVSTDSRPRRSLRVPSARFRSSGCRIRKRHAPRASSSPRNRSDLTNRSSILRAGLRSRSSAQTADRD